MKLTAYSMGLFVELASEANNYNGTPWIPDLTKEERGNLSDLVKKGLIEVYEYEGNLKYAKFTEEGKKLAARMGFEIV